MQLWAREAVILTPAPVSLQFCKPPRTHCTVRKDRTNTPKSWLPSSGRLLPKPGLWSCSRPPLDSRSTFPLQLKPGSPPKSSEKSSTTPSQRTRTLQQFKRSMKILRSMSQLSHNSSRKPKSSSSLSSLRTSTTRLSLPAPPPLPTHRSFCCRRSKSSTTLFSPIRAFTL